MRIRVRIGGENQEQDQVQDLDEDVENEEEQTEVKRTVVAHLCGGGWRRSRPNFRRIWSSSQ